MINVDIAVVGVGRGIGGRWILGRAGISTRSSIHRQYPFDFRCEKIDHSQVLLLRKAGLFDIVARAATHADQLSIARNGQVVDKRPTISWISSTTRS